MARQFHCCKSWVFVILGFCIVRPSVDLTNEEYNAKTGKTVSIQKIVEKPHLHFIARCGSSEAEQLTYSETRLTCIKEMATNLTTPTGNECIDTARFFHGDNPAREVEAGQQKGRHYFCSNCGCHAERVHELDHVLNCPIISFQDRMDTVMKQFKNLLFKYYILALENIYDVEDPRTWKSVCIKCNSARSLMNSPLTCCF